MHFRIGFSCEIPLVRERKFSYGSPFLRAWLLPEIRLPALGPQTRIVCRAGTQLRISRDLVFRFIMGELEFLFVLIGVIVGLALCQILTGVANIVSSRHLVRVYWVHLVWVGVLFLQLVYYWHVQHSTIDVEREFLGYVAAMVFPTLLYLGVALLLPQIDQGEHFDYRRHYYENAEWFFGICGAGVLVLIYRNTHTIEQLWQLPNIIRYAALVLLGLLMWNRNRKLHAALAITTTVLLLGFALLCS